MEVNKIPAEIQRLLSASARINNYKRAVEELVYNSLDAESTCIAIRIHIQKNWIQLVDNGIGIKKADYKLLGERYATSKLIDENTLKAAPSKYGYQGQALSNIIEVSQSVKITSRSANTNETWVKIFHEGNKEPECFKVPMRPSKGTTVEVKGFLFNLNIQKKSISEFNECEDIKFFLKQLSLVFSNVSITLRDDAQNNIIFKVHKSKDIYQTLKSLFDVDIGQIQELQVEKNAYKVKAYIGIEKRKIKDYGWIYLNNKFMLNSNIHNIINNKFTKRQPTKLKKIKTLGAYNEESVVGQLVPFYFLFITCPYYDYDILYSGKKNTVEFKNWEQINKLLEKLVRFYEGDMDRLNTENTKKRQQLSTEIEDTKNQVKRIMEKILGKPNTISRVSQIPNGVKGKRVKRKKKNQEIEKPLMKFKIPPLNDDINIAFPSKEIACVNEKICGNKFDKHAIIKKHDSNIQIKEMIKKYNTTHKANKNCRKFSKNAILHKYNIKHNNLMEIFNNNSDTLQRRCNELSSYLEHFLNFKDSQPFTITCLKNKSPLLNDNNQDSQGYKKTEKTNTPTIRQQQISMNYNNPMTEKIRSYDLLQTIINTQQAFIDEGLRRDDKLYATKRSNLQQETNSKSYDLSPHTYDSHTYNIKQNYNSKKKNRNINFITKQSRDNFNIKAGKAKGDFRITTGKITKSRSLCNDKTKIRRDIDKLHDDDKFNKILKKDKQGFLGTPFSIDIPESNIIDFSKRIRNRIVNDMKSILDNEDYDTIHKSQFDSTEQLNVGVNLNIESTYTILMDSLYNSSPITNTNKKVKTSLQKTITYENIKSSNKIYRNHASKIMPNNILMPEPQCVFSTDATMEPLDICEAIIDSPLHFHDELHKNLNCNTANCNEASSLIIEKLKSNEASVTNNLKNLSNFDINNECPKYGSAITIDKNYETKATENYDLLSRTEDGNYNGSATEILHGNSVGNFTLNTRNRYLPKGTSQIFLNCFSKDICSYNLETEYYENIIYNNFIEDVAANSEIFEPQVQNMKEFLTKDIQKVTDKIKKHNADLIFGTDSLREVLGQVDSKFIAAKIQQAHESSEFLVFFDQHAVHERICLETNLSYYFNGNNWKKVTIDTLSLKSSKDDILYLHNHKEKFTRFGLDWTITNKSEIIVNAIPEAIRGKNPRPMETIVRAVKNLIIEEIHALKYLKGNVSIYPQSIMNLIFSEACRYAIKFGDHLSLKDCKELIGALANCKTPFQCAHGRPVMAVMMELKNEHFEYKVNMNNIMQFKNLLKQ